MHRGYLPRLSARTADSTAPDNHPKQIAGTQLPGSCTLNDQKCPDAGPPDTFVDCSNPPCEVSLDAFTADPGAIPYCEGDLAAARTSPWCTESPPPEGGSCEGLYTIRYTYGPPGDNFTCVYYEPTGALIGAARRRRCVRSSW